MEIRLSSTKKKEHLVHRLKDVIELAPESPPFQNKTEQNKNKQGRMHVGRSSDQKDPSHLDGELSAAIILTKNLSRH